MLTNCKDCRREISADAKQCPGCGARPMESWMLTILKVLTFTAVVAVAYGWYQTR
jgi:RNA polymerase subunit RPABC4/transcription elongation factor Spt4